MNIVFLKGDFIFSYFLPYISSKCIFFSNLLIFNAVVIDVLKKNCLVVEDPSNAQVGIHYCSFTGNGNFSNLGSNATLESSLESQCVHLKKLGFLDSNLA